MSNRQHRRVAASIQRRISSRRDAGERMQDIHLNGFAVVEAIATDEKAMRSVRRADEASRILGIGPSASAAKARSVDIYQEALVMQSIEELKNDPIFCEEVKDLVKQTIKASVRTKPFSDYVSEIVKNAAKDVAADVLAEASDEIASRVRGLVDSTLQPTIDREVRAAITDHVAKMKAKIGL